MKFTRTLLTALCTAFLCTQVSFAVHEGEDSDTSNHVPMVGRTRPISSSLDTTGQATQSIGFKATAIIPSSILFSVPSENITGLKRERPSEKS